MFCDPSEIHGQIRLVMFMPKFLPRSECMEHNKYMSCLCSQHGQRLLFSFFHFGLTSFRTDEEILAIISLRLGFFTVIFLVDSLGTQIRFPSLVRKTRP
jgi:hypothetical protein